MKWFKMVSPCLTLRLAEMSDAALLLSWANDPEIRKQSFCQNKISQNEHNQWLANTLANPDCVQLIGLNESSTEVGQVRFDINREKREAVIAISIASNFRGRGMSKILLQQAIDYFHSKNPTIKLIAEVKDTNLVSQQLFSDLQFSLIPARRVMTKTYELNYNHSVTCPLKVS